MEGVRIKFSVEGLTPVDHRDGIAPEKERDSPEIIQQSVGRLCQLIRDLGSWNTGIEIAHEAGSLDATIICQSNADAHQVIHWFSDGPWQAKNTFDNYIPE